MGNDIVARLRNRRGTAPALCDEAADEIERWRTIAYCSYCEPQHDYFCTKHREEEDEPTN